jgi:SAM-dependent methyltransferase
LAHPSLIGKAVAGLLEWHLPYRLLAALLAPYKTGWVLPLLPKQSGLRILDVGCGPGTHAGKLQQHDYVGLDTNEHYIAAAKRLYPKASFYHGVIQNLPPMDPFDVVLIDSVLHHLDDQTSRELLTRAVELLGSGGSVIIQEPLHADGPQALPRVIMRLDRGDHYRTLDVWRALFQQCHLAPEYENVHPLQPLGLKLGRLAAFRLKPVGVPVS